MQVRVSVDRDQEQICDVHRQAFGEHEGPVIAQLVHDLLRDPTAQPILSIIAVENDHIIGHVLFTKVSISNASVNALILAPLAVLPENQKRGVGKQLINTGLCTLKTSGTELVFVLGHPSYYPRYGFVPAGQYGLKAPYPIPPEHADAWMVQQLNGDILGRISGTVQCSDILNEPQHWRE